MKKLFVLLSVLGVLSIHGVSLAGTSTEIVDPCENEDSASGVSVEEARAIVEAADAAAGESGSTD